ncbi:MAG: hypothetical protein RJA44_2332 [Pseudomonadota bacterium]|jgi:hypothetical protein
MGFFDVLWHLGNFLLPACGLGLIASALAKLVWRHALGGVPWLALLRWAVTGGLLAELAGLILSGRDGRMSTYLLMVLACALALWWRGFMPRRGGGRPAA